MVICIRGRRLTNSYFYFTLICNIYALYCELTFVVVLKSPYILRSRNSNQRTYKMVLRDIKTILWYAYVYYLKLHFIIKRPHWCIPEYGVYISQLIEYTRAYSSYGGFIDRGRLLTYKSLLIKVINLKNWRSTFESIMVVTKNYYNILMWPNPMLKCIAYTWLHWMTGYDWAYFRFHGGYLAKAGDVYFFRGTYSHTWVFPSVFVVFGLTFIPGFCNIGGLMVDWRLSENDYVLCILIDCLPHK